MMINYLKYSLGIDVSKDENQLCLSLLDDKQNVKIKASRKFTNTAKGFEQTQQWLHKHIKLDLPLHIALEATGVYHEELSWFLYEKGYSLSIILPNKAKHYLKATGLKSKNDSIDAIGLSRMAAEQNLPLWQPCSKELLALKALTRHLEKLQNIRTSISNQVHALKHSYMPDKMIIKSNEKLLKEIDKQIEKAEEKLEARLKKDAALGEKVEKISSSIKGLGKKTIAVILAETDAFSNIENLRQLSSYAGYDVVENQSGKRVGKTKISKKGNSHIRRAMFMPALNMVRYEVKPFLALYQRIYGKTGIKMKAYTAIQRKLLLLIYTLWKKDETYNPQQYNTSSGIDEPKPLFSLGSTGATVKIAPDKAGATQDGLPCNESPVALFSLLQN
jgi:transposase